MVRDEITLRAAVELGAWAIAWASSAVLLLALAAELIRRRNAHSVVVVMADRLLPTAGHRAAVALLAVMSGVVGILGTQTASADESVRHWLEAPAAHAATPPTPNDGPDAAATSPSPSTTPSRADATASSPAHGAPPGPPVVPAPPATAWEVPAPRAATVVRPAESLQSRNQPRASPRAAKPEPESVTIERRVPAPTPIRRPALTSATPTVVPPVAAPPPSVTYVVVPGDCLWSIAARALGSGATNAGIDRGWRTVYDANRAAIGDDPNLIRPGLMLSLPSLTLTPTVTP